MPAYTILGARHRIGQWEEHSEQQGYKADVVA